MTKITLSKKFGGKTYKLVHVEWNSLYVGYGGESATKAAADKKADKLRQYGYSARVNREIHTRYPSKGPEVFYIVYARMDGMTLDRVEVIARRILEH